MARDIEPIRRVDHTLLILDQRKLPDREEWLTCTTGEQVKEAIASLAVRGAPAIGIAGLYGLWLEARRLYGREQFARELHASAESLRSARPTAVNLAWAIDGAMRRIRGMADNNVVEALKDMADTLKTQDAADNRRMGEWGASLFTGPVRILTHCNTGSLATAGYGTALGVIRALHQRGWIREVFVDETRPLLQGARLTAWELLHDGIAARLVTDSMAGHLMAQGLVDAVIVGADRIAKNGDTANKIGTYGLAILAHYHHIPFYVAAPIATFDPATAHGDQIPIEERNPDEVRTVLGHAIAPNAIGVYNPAFDVTPHDLISAIVTERGVAAAPLERSLDALNRDLTPPTT